jgi:hypothetical protein
MPAERAEDHNREFAGSLDRAIPPPATPAVPEIALESCLVVATVFRVRRLGAASAAEIGLGIARGGVFGP